MLVLKIIGQACAGIYYRPENKIGENLFLKIVQMAGEIVGVCQQDRNKNVHRFETLIAELCRVSFVFFEVQCL